MIHYVLFDAKHSPPTMTERIRTTISLDPEVYQVFKDMADITGLSVSRCMGDWLGDTRDGAVLVTEKIAEVRRSSDLLMRQVNKSMKAELVNIKATTDLFERRGAAADTGALRRGEGPTPPPSAPSSNTGLKYHRQVKPSGSKG